MQNFKFLEGNFLSSDRSGRCDYFWFYVAQSKSALKMPFRMIKIPSRNILIDENLLTDQLPFVFQGHKCRIQLSPSQIQTPPPSLISHFHILAFRRNYLAIYVSNHLVRRCSALPWQKHVNSFCRAQVLESTICWNSAFMRYFACETFSSFLLGTIKI